MADAASTSLQNGTVILNWIFSSSMLNICGILGNDFSACDSSDSSKINQEAPL